MHAAALYLERSRMAGWTDVTNDPSTETWIPVTVRSAFDIGQSISPGVSARWFHALYDTPLLFSGILDQRGVVLDANHLAIEGCGFVRGETIGRLFWECGWWSPDPTVARQLRQWCERSISSRSALQAKSRYFVGDGSERMVDLTLFPVFDDEPTENPMAYIIATGSDITDALVAQAAHEEQMAVEAKALRQVAEVRTSELSAVRESERETRDRLARLAGVALELVNTQSVEELAEIVFDRGFPVIGADGGSIVVRESDEFALATSERLPEGVGIVFGRLPLDSPLPCAHVARSGERVVLPSRASGVAFTPEMAEVYELSGRGTWAIVPMQIGNRLLGSVAVAWVDEREVTASEISLIEAFSAQCAQVVERIRVSRSEAAAAREIEHMVLSLQRSLLTRPPRSAEFEMTVRYLPAIQEAQVGGDWYDAFTTTAGAMLLSVGDVAGHDGDAAAAMAQLRNLLRGLAFDSDDSPAVLLSRLDHAIAGLGLDAVATALVARVEATPADRQRRVWRVRWSSAGHLPAIVRFPDGEVHILLERADLLLGFDPDAERVERVSELPAGSVLLLYTDGLVERRHEHLDVGLHRLADALAATKSDTLDGMCDELVDAMLPDFPSDDVAILMLRPHTVAPDSGTTGATR